MIRTPNRRTKNVAFLSRAERESRKERSLRTRLSRLITRQQLKDFGAGIVAGLVLLSPIWLQIVGCVTD